MKINKYKKYNGFTLIEVLLVVTIFTIILSSAISLTGKQVFENDLIAKSLEVSDLIEKARNNSATGFRGDVWSIKILDSNALCKNSGDCILLFKGRSFIGREIQYDRFVEFDEDITGVYINADQENEFYFSYKSAWLATTTASYLEQQHIVLNSNFGEQKSIVVQSSGVVSVFTCGEDKVFDVEGNGYLTVKIDEQCWMSENLNTGTMLADASTDDPLDNGVIEKWCESDNSSNCDNNQGGLYNWDEAMAYVAIEGAQGICPSGWHIPSDPELDILVANYTAESAGTVLKLGGSSGFNLVESNEMNNDTGTYDDSDLSVLWSSTGWGDLSTYSYMHYTDTLTATISNDTNDQTYGFSIRCLKDY